LCEDVGVHLVPADRRSRRILDGERVCRAIDAIGEPSELSAWVSRFALLGDQTRLMVLLAIAEAGPISVTDLATATGVHDTTVSQCLRLLRATGVVQGRRDGRVVLYVLTDSEIGQLLKALIKPADRRSHAVN
jgi:ArsR family transcriptional regulator, lead/cadmium/zinc/bismuth-responsive transcriptional repressor